MAALNNNNTRCCLHTHMQLESFKRKTIILKHILIIKAEASRHNALKLIGSNYSIFFSETSAYMSKMQLLIFILHVPH